MSRSIILAAVCGSLMSDAFAFVPLMSPDAGDNAGGVEQLEGTEEGKGKRTAADADVVKSSARKLLPVFGAREGADKDGKADARNLGLVSRCVALILSERFAATGLKLDTKKTPAQQFDVWLASCIGDNGEKIPGLVQDFADTLGDMLTDIQTANNTSITLGEVDDTPIKAVRVAMGAAGFKVSAKTTNYQLANLRF